MTKFSETDIAINYIHPDKEKILDYIEKMNSKDSEFNKIESVEERSQAVMKEVGLKKIPIGVEQKAFDELTVYYLSYFQHHNRYTLLRTREHVFLETIRNLMQPLDPIEATISVDAEERLKNVKLKGDLNDLAGRLVGEIETLYKEIYGANEEAAKGVMKVSMTPEQRLKRK